MIAERDDAPVCVGRKKPIEMRVEVDIGGVPIGSVPMFEQWTSYRHYFVDGVCENCGTGVTARWLVRGYYQEDWPEHGDESDGVADVYLAADEQDAKAQYRDQHDSGGVCSSVIAWHEGEWNDHLRGVAEYAEMKKGAR